MDIRRIKIFFRLMGHFFARGLANKKPKDIKRIVIFHSAGLGDMVCLTPMFRAVKSFYPNARLYVVGQPIYRELLAGNSDVDEYVSYNDKPEEIGSYLRTQSIDFGCIPSPSFAGLSALYWGNVACIVSPRVVGGLNPQQTILYRMLSQLTLKKTIRFSSYMPREYLKLLEPVGIHFQETQKYLKFSEAAKEGVRAFFENNDVDPSKDLVVGISPSSGNKIKNWGSVKFAALADYIHRHYRAKIIVTGGHNDVSEINEMVNLVKPGTQIINSVNVFTMDELKAFIASIHVFIAVDTGPIYIAEAFHTPTIDIVGPVAENEQPPIGRHHVVVRWEQRLVAAIHILNARMYDFAAARQQVDMISSDQVQRSFDSLLEVLVEDHKVPQNIKL